MDRGKETAKSLLSRYLQLKDDLLEHTGKHHDDMLWDIVGYDEEEREEDFEIEYRDELWDKVTHIMNLIKAYETGGDTLILEANMKYTFC